MKIIKSFFSLSLLLALCACSQSGSDGHLSDNEIRLTYRVDELSGGVTTRGVYNQDNLPASGLAVRFARLDQQDGNFPAYPAATLVDATLSADGTVAFDQKQYYQDNGAGSRFLGWFPAEEPTEGAVTFALNGATDVMLTGEQTGSLSQPFNGGDNSFRFTHCLSQLQVQAYVLSDDDVAKYGQVTAIRVLGQPSSCTLVLPAAAATFAQEGVADLTLKNPADDADMAAVSLLGSTKAAPASCGYLLFAPVGNTIDLEIDTESYGTYPLSLTLPEGKTFEAGKAYTARLRFGSNDILPQIQIGEWSVAAEEEVDMTTWK